MGLSASQMRYLSLTARCSNVEYQGQQVNQARTELANQLGDLYNQLYNLKPPVAPSVYEYVLDPPTQPIFDWNLDDSFNSNSVNRNFVLYYSCNRPNFANFNIPIYTVSTDANGKKTYTDEDGNATNTEPGIYATVEKGKTSDESNVGFYKIHTNENAYFTYNQNSFMFENKAGDETPLPQYAQAYNAAMACYKTYSDPNITTYYAEDADLSKINSEILSERPEPIGYSHTSSKSANEAQYAAAMAEYKKAEEEYQLAIDQINAKTEQIHESDKKLELQLKKLETERTAITTELESVKKVIDKNIENTYKSFNA